MKLLIINNLASGYQEGAIYDFIRAFSQDNDEIVLRATDGRTDLRAFLHDASDFDAVVISGGDGSIATVSHELANTGIPLVPFPAGTANLLCANLAQPNEPHALAEMVRAGKTLDFDVAEIEVAGKRYGFNIMAGAGYDATIMKNAAASKQKLGQVAYFAAVATNITPKVAHMKLTLDNNVIESDGVGVVLINHSKIQFDIPVAHDTDPRDGMLDVAVLKTANALGLLPALGAALLDRNGEFPGRSSNVEVHRARQVKVEAYPGLPIEFDGEPLDSTEPFIARVLPRAARFIVSPEALKLYGEEKNAC